ncbi:MAG: hypothetical protein EAZ61_08760 [Oscillatoriales cyanobacterium]|nr:MAG: hypothetical protein EAZ61_08760 [Oscillatoriales cyanobacterium]
MKPIDEPLPWRVSTNASYVPLEYEGQVIGYCELDYADELATTMNEQATLHKALRMACRDLLKRMNKDVNRASELADRYVKQAKRPTSGPRALAFMLAERQRELGLSPQEFFKFCDTFKISEQDIAHMADGHAVASHNIAPISRVLGITPTEVEAVLGQSS